MIVKKTYDDGTYAIFKVLDITQDYNVWWLEGLVYDTDVDNINKGDKWQFELYGNIEVLVV
mgnify:FL=1